jgi:hypothetical protein
VDHLRDVLFFDWATTEMNLSENQARQCLFPKSECDSAGFLYRREGMTFIMRDQVIELFSKGMRLVREPVNRGTRYGYAMVTAEALSTEIHPHQSSPPA